MTRVQNVYIESSKKKEEKKWSGVGGGAKVYGGDAWSLARPSQQ